MRLLKYALPPLSCPRCFYPQPKLLQRDVSVGTRAAVTGPPPQIRAAYEICGCAAGACTTRHTLQRRACITNRSISDSCGGSYEPSGRRQRHTARSSFRVGKYVYAPQVERHAPLVRASCTTVHDTRRGENSPNQACSGGTRARGFAPTPNFASSVFSVCVVNVFNIYAFDC